MRSLTWEKVATAFATLVLSATIALVGVVWGQSSELSAQKERVDNLKAQILDMRESVEKKLDKIDGKLDEHLKGDK